MRAMSTTTSEKVVYGVCIGGVLVENGEYTESADAITRATAEFHSLRAEGYDEPVQVLIWPAE